MYIQPQWRRDRPAPQTVSRARLRLRRRMLAASLVLHTAALVGLLLLTPPPKPPSPAEASFDIVLDGGAAKPATPGSAATAPPATAPGSLAPVPGPEPEPSPPPAPSLPPAPALLPSEAAPPAALPAPATQPPSAAPPEPASPELPSPTEAPPAPAPEPPVAPEPPEPAPLQPTPPRVAIPMPALPLLVPIPQPPLPTPPLPARPRPLRPAPRPAPRSPSGFPAPQDWSFGGAQTHPSQQGAPGPALTVGPSLPAPRITGAQLGRDWIAAYSAWVQSHLYYPEQAALNGEDGTAEVIMTIDRFGKVTRLELVSRSGSQWLDLSTLSMFRGAHVPPFPQGTKDDTATIDQTIHYILRRH